MKDGLRDGLTYMHEFESYREALGQEISPLAAVIVNQERNSRRVLWVMVDGIAEPHFAASSARRAAWYRRL